VFSAEAVGAGLPPNSATPDSGSAADAGLDVAEPIPVRPLRLRELLDLPYALIQADIRTLAGLGGAGFAMAALLVVALTAAGSAATHGSDAGTAWVAIVSTLVFAWLLRIYLRGVTVPIGLARVHRQQLTWRAALRRSGTKSGPLLLSGLLYTLVGVGVLALGTPLLITLLPAVVWLAWLRARRMLVVPVLFEERVSHRVAVMRASLLVAGAEWQLVGLWLSLRLLLAVLVLPMIGIPLFVADFSGTHRWAVIALLTAGFLLIAGFAEVAESATRVVTYIDRRCRREAWDVRIPDLRTGFGDTGRGDTGFGGTAHA
jgi:hypothetical protein